MHLVSCRKLLKTRGKTGSPVLALKGCGFTEYCAVPPAYQSTHRRTTRILSCWPAHTHWRGQTINSVLVLGPTAMFPVREPGSSGTRKMSPPLLPLASTNSWRLIFPPPQRSFRPRSRVSASPRQWQGFKRATKQVCAPGQVRTPGKPNFFTIISGKSKCSTLHVSQWTS